MKLKPKGMRYFDFKALRETCLMKEEEFEKFGVLTKHENGLISVFRNKGSDVLAVAHLDSVQAGRYCDLVGPPGQERIYSSVLDDRLGAYAILFHLPAMGCKYDILLTTGEERGASTAQHFHPEKKYNWIFSLDRMGKDCAMYGYLNDEMRTLLRKFDMIAVQGLNSDIAYMYGLGVKGFNFGVGYQDYHSTWGYAPLEDYIAQINKVFLFYWKMKDSRLEHKMTAESTGRSHWYGSAYGDYEDGVNEGENYAMQLRGAQRGSWPPRGDDVHGWDSYPGKGYAYDIKTGKYLPTQSKVQSDVKQLSVIAGKQTIVKHDVFAEGVKCGSCHSMTGWVAIAHAERCIHCGEVIPASLYSYAKMCQGAID